MTKFVKLHGKLCHCAAQKRPKTPTVLARVFVLINSLICGGAGKPDKNDQKRSFLSKVDLCGIMPYNRKRSKKMEQEMSKQARLEARIPQDVHALLKRAAEIEGRTMSDFVVSAASAAARQTIEETQMIRLSAEDQKRFVEALLKPAQVAPAMVRAFEHHKRLISGL